MSCLLMSYDLNCTDCNVTSLSSTAMGKMMLGHNGVRGSREYKDRVADGESKQEHLPKHRKTYPLRKRIPSQSGDISSLGIAKDLEGMSADGVSPTQPIAERWDYQGGHDRRRVEGPAEEERSEDTGKENDRTAAVDPHTVEPRPRRLASLNAEAVNNLLLEREDCPSSSRRCRRSASCGMEYPESRPEHKAGHPAKKRAGSLGGPLDGDVYAGGGLVPAKKRIASLNAAAFLKLSNGKDSSGSRRHRADGVPKPVRGMGGTRLPYLHPHTKRREPRSSVAAVPSSNPGTGLQQAGSANSGQHTSRLPITADLPCHCADKTKQYFHQLSMLIGDHAMIPPKYHAVEENIPSGADFAQAFQSHSKFTLLDNFVSATDHYEFLPPEVCLASPEDDLFLHYDRSDLLPIGCNSPHSCSMCSASFSCCTPPDDEGALLISQSTVPSGIPYSPSSCRDSLCFVGDTAAVQCVGVTGYDLCGVLHPSLSRDLVRRTLTSNQTSSLSDLGLKTGEYKSLESLSVHTPVTGHLVSPSNPLSSCPVPTAPSAAEPVPQIQRPASDTPAATRPHTLSTVKLTRECPQSTKPPSSSKYSIRNPISPPAQLSKAGTGHTDSKQLRIGKRRATNGWLPAGEPLEKPVYIVGEVQPLIRKCFPAVERDGEVVKVRDTVLLKSGPRRKSIPYVAKVSALWEDPTSGELMMSLYWYYRPEHIQGGRNPNIHCENEIFASRHQDENSVACIEEKCYVLTFSEYCRFCALAKWREEGSPDRPLIPPSEEYSIPSHRKVPENTDPDLVFICRHVYDFRHGRTLKNPQ